MSQKKPFKRVLFNRKGKSKDSIESSSAEEIKIENPRESIYTAPRMQLWAHLICQKLLLLLPFVYSLTLIHVLCYPRPLTDDTMSVTALLSPA